MPFQPFAARSAEQRAVLIPSELGAEERERFIKRIKSAVLKQAESAQKCDAILRLQTEVQVEQDRILIAHEPAAVADPEIIESSDDRPGIDTLWWLTASLVRALCGFADDKAPHGGIQPAALYLDETGRVKLGDFGIAPAYESVCGLDNRRYVACDTAVNESGGVALSGCWGLLNEDESRDYGWIAPYFAHELLDGRVRLNFKSDQFALGVLLFLLATGTHPYGATLSDPTLLFYFHLEPYAFEDERGEWEEIFERESKGVAGSADKPVLAWAELVRRMCAGPEASDRCSSPAEAQEQAKPHVRPAWEAASSAIARAVACLENGQPDAALEGVSAWVADEALSDIWRERLSAWAKRLEDEKEVIVRRNALKRRLEDGQAALDDQDLERARAIAKEVAADEDADDALMREVDRLLRECDEHEKFVREGAGELANQYLESGREALVKGELREARENFEAVLKDPAMPPARVEQANKLLLEIEATEQRGKEQLAALNEAIVEYREGRYAEARQRLENLLVDESLPESVAAQARLLLKDVSETGDRVAEFAQALDDARAAWERADLAALEDCLGSVPQDFADPNITTRRGELVESYDTLRMAVEHKRNAERRLEADDAAAALQESRQAAAIEPLPPVLLEELAALTGRCEQKVREQQAAILENAGAMLDKAELGFEAGDAEQCSKLVDAVLQTEGLSSEVITRASNLHESCETLQQTLAVLDTAQRYLGEDRFDEADAALDGAPAEGMPKVVAEQARTLRAEIKTARDDVVERERLRLERQIDEVIAAESEGKLEHADTVLGTVESSQHLPDAMRARVAELRSTITAQLPILEAVKAAEAALNGDGADSARVLSLLDKLPGDLPAWADDRVAAIRARAAEIEQQQQRAAAERIGHALQTAEQKLDKLDWKAARTALEGIAKDVRADEALAKRHKELAARAEALAAHMPAVEKLEQSLVAGKIAEVSRELIELLKNKSLPEPAVKRLKTLRDKCKAAIKVVREKAAAELKAIEAALVTCKFREPALGTRIGTVSADPLITKEQRAAAEALQQKHDTLPIKKSKAVPAVAAVALVGMIGAAAWFLWPEPSSPPTPEQMQAAIERIELEIDAKGIELGQDPVDFTLSHEPDEESVPTLKLNVEGKLADTRRIETLGQLEAITVDDYRRFLFPPLAITGDQMREAIVSITQEIEDQARKLSRNLREYYFEHRLEDDGGATLTLNVQGKPPTTRRIETLEQLAAVKGADFLESVLEPMVVTPPDNTRITRLDANTRIENAGIDAAYRNELVIAVVEDVKSANAAGELLDVHAKVRLKKDKGRGEFFKLKGTVDKGVFTAKPPASEFAGYLADVQKSVPPFTDGLGDDLGVAIPGGLAAAVATPFAGGDTATIVLRDANDPSKVLARLPYDWEPQSLSYVLRQADAIRSIRDGVRARVAEAWPRLLPAVAPDAGRPGSAYFTRCKVLKATPVDGPAAEVFRPVVNVEIGPDTRLGRGFPIKLGARLAFRDGRIEWGPSERDAKATIAAELKQLSEDADYRRRRMDERMAAVQAELVADDVQVEMKGDVLNLTATIDGGPKRYESTWVPAELNYGLHIAKATLEDTLKTLAAATEQVAAGDFVSALRGITEDKASRIGVQSYVVGAALADDARPPEDALRGISTRLQALVAPNPATDRFPVVFVEYFVGDEQVYGLRWRADTDGQDRITGVSGWHVWSVMSTVNLPMPKSVREAQEFSMGTLPGQDVLGLALDGELQASGGGSYGLMVAPDKQLWWTRWDLVVFDPIAVRGLDSFDADPPPASVSSIGEVMWQSRGRAGIAYRRVGIWCVPALGGEFAVPARSLRRPFDFGAGALRAKQHRIGRDWQSVAIVSNARVPNRSQSWPDKAKDMTAATIGHFFWGEAPNWAPNPVSFFVLQLRQP